MRSADQQADTEGTRSRRGWKEGGRGGGLTKEGQTVVADLSLVEPVERLEHRFAVLGLVNELRFDERLHDEGDILREHRAKESGRKEEGGSAWDSFLGRLSRRVR